MSFTQGADVSVYQNDSASYIDLLHSKGARFLFIKVSQGNWYHNDKEAVQASNGAKKFSKVGAYHYLDSTANPKVQAGYLLYFIKASKTFNKKSPIALDVEDSSLPYYTTSLVNQWLDAMYNAGCHNLVVYGPGSWFTSGRINKSELHHNPLIWVAAYGVDQPGVDGTDIWQYTDNGHGTSTDFNYLFNDSKLLGYETEKKSVKVKPHYYQKGTKFRARGKLNQYSDVHLKHKTGVQWNKDRIIYGHIVIDHGYPRIKTNKGHYYSASVALVKRLG